MQSRSKSRAHKGHAHTVLSGRQDTPSYTAAPAPSQGPAAQQGITQSGQKALMFRARKELAPLADPTQSIVE